MFNQQMEAGNAQMGTDFLPHLRDRRRIRLHWNRSRHRSHRQVLFFIAVALFVIFLILGSPSSEHHPEPLPNPEKAGENRHDKIPTLTLAALAAGCPRSARHM